MPVEIIIDQWKPETKQYRTETFCYGQSPVRYIKLGQHGKCGSQGMTWEEEDWVDEYATSHRGADD